MYFIHSKSAQALSHNLMPVRFRYNSNKLGYLVSKASAD